MGIVFRQSVKTTIVTFTGALLGAAVVFLSTQFLPKQEYGFIRNLTSEAVMATQLFLLGLNNTMSVYIHQYKDNDRRKQVLITFCLFIPFTLIAIATVFYYLFQNPIIHLFQPQDIPYIKRYFIWLPIFTLLFSYEMMMEQYVLSQMKVALATFTREVILRIVNISLVVLFGLGLISFSTFVGATVLAYLVPILLLLFISVRTKGFGLSFSWNVFTKGEYKELLHFTWYHALLSISVNMMGILDVLMLAPLSKNGLADVAIYIVALFFITIMMIPYKSMLNSTFPILAQTYKSDDKARMADIFYRSSVNILVATIGISMIILCNLPNAVAVMKNGYGEIIPLVMILTLGRVVDVAAGMNDQILSISSYYKTNFYLSLSLVVLMIIFNLAFIPSYGIYGAAWSSTLALIIYNIAKTIYIWRKLRLQPFSTKTLLVVICGLAALAVGYFMPYILNPYVDTIIRSIAIIVVYGIMLLWLKPSGDILEYLATIRKNKRLF